MAERKRSKKKKTTKNQTSNELQASPADTEKPSPVQNVLQDASKLADDLTGKVRSMFHPKPEAEAIQSPEQTPSPSAVGSPMSPIPSSESEPRNVSQLADTVAQIQEEFGPAPDAGAAAPGSPAPDSQHFDAGPAVIEPPDHDFIPRDTIRQILELLFEGVGKRYGSQHRLSPDESRALTPLTVDMVNEQGPRWFGESENHALWIWITVMGLFIAARSAAGGKILEWISDMLTGANKQKVQRPQQPEKKQDAAKDTTPSTEDTIKAGSLEFSDSSGFQAPAKPL